MTGITSRYAVDATVSAPDGTTMQVEGFEIDTGAGMFYVGHDIVVAGGSSLLLVTELNPTPIDPIQVPTATPDELNVALDLLVRGTCDPPFQATPDSFPLRTGTRPQSP